MYLLSTKFANDFETYTIVGDFGDSIPGSISDEPEGVKIRTGGKPFGSVEGANKYYQLFRLYRVIQNVNADIYIFRGTPRMLTFIYPPIELLNKKLVYHIANDEYISHIKNNSGLTFRLQKRAIQQSTVISQTEKQQTQLQNNFGVSSTVIPNGYPAINDRTVMNTGDYFLWIGRINKDQKRPHLLLKLAKTVSEAFVVVGGAASDQEYYKAFVSECNQMDNVDHVGKVPPAEVHQYYRNAKALINTSKYEGFPNTFLEAWRQATPVVSLEIDPRRFLPIGTDICYAGEQYDQFVEYIEILNTNEQLRKQIGLECQKTFEENYTINMIYKKYKDVIRKITS